MISLKCTHSTILLSTKSLNCRLALHIMGLIGSARVSTAEGHEVLASRFPVSWRSVEAALRRAEAHDGWKQYGRCRRRTILWSDVVGRAERPATGSWIDEVDAAKRSNSFAE